MQSKAGYLGESGRQQLLGRFQEHWRSVELRTKVVGEHFLEQWCGTGELNCVPFRKYLGKLLISKHYFVESNLGIDRNH